MKIPDRIIWSFWRRFVLARSLPSFSASVLSYSCPKTTFSGYHSVKKFTELYAVSVGRFTYFAENIRARNCAIGPFCSIGPDVILGDLPKHPSDRISSHPLFYSTNPVSGLAVLKVPTFQEYSHTIVGADVFIGARALIMPGLELGHGCMIGAGAVVTKNVAPYAIVAGVPAKTVRYRFTPEVIMALLEIKWWEWDVPRQLLWQQVWQRETEVTLLTLKKCLQGLETH